MGNLFSFSLEALYGSLASYFGNRESRIMIIGLDAAGKTTLLYKIKLGELVTTIPTIGFNVETFEYKNIKFTAWDIGGQEKIRSLWKHYLCNNDAVIFVVDAADLERVDEAKQALHLIFEAEELANTKLLVYANKQDQPNVLSAEELRERLELSEATKNPTHVQPCVATSGDGIYEGLDWLSRAVSGEFST
ncbi:ADP-ribosylation factor [Phytophthora cinnamomi]|uniref:ADP-ribosylation factor n=1 Tax=Phytophthora cinnamomi TaxID=4785 RepID=UPI003559637F|nr:ADP-ribosylation factor [Phytophthora cinnamomi]